MLSTDHASREWEMQIARINPDVPCVLYRDDKTGVVNWMAADNYERFGLGRNRTYLMRCTREHAVRMRWLAFEPTDKEE